MIGVSEFSGAGAWVGGSAFGIIAAAAFWLFRISNRVLDRGDERDERNWDQLQAELIRKDRENETLRLLLSEERTTATGYLTRLRACLDGSGGTDP